MTESEQLEAALKKIKELEAANEIYRIRQILYNANAFLVEKLQNELNECNCNK